ncbi:MAG: hypothetical protein KDJ17_11265 [Hyphomicrobiaceae bacterium]|nr:hypothetical protein [Hyphomicrobiaceae bacterium]
MRFSGIALGAAALAAAIAVSAIVPATAAPSGSLGVMKSISAEQTMVSKTHGWHRTCRRGFTDVHRHVPGVGRVACTSRRCWKNKWGVRRCRWY